MGSGGVGDGGLVMVLVVVMVMESRRRRRMMMMSVLVSSARVWTDRGERWWMTVEDDGG